VNNVVFSTDRVIHAGSGVDVCEQPDTPRNARLAGRTTRHPQSTALITST